MTIEKQIESYYRQHRKEFVNRLYYRVGSHEAAEDVVQEAFLRAWQYRDTFSEELYPLEAWFSRILNNTMKDFKRQTHNRGNQVEFNEFDYEDDSAPLDVKVYTKEVRSFIDGWDDPVYKEAYELYFFSQYKCTDIAKVLDTTPGAIRTAVCRFKEEFRNKYSKQ